MGGELFQKNNQFLWAGIKIDPIQFCYRYFKEILETLIISVRDYLYIAVNICSEKLNERLNKKRLSIYWQFTS